MWWLPPNYLLFRYPVWPPNHPPGGVNLGVFRTPRIRGVFQDPSREMRVSAFHRNRGFRDSASFAFCTGIAFPGFRISKFHQWSPRSGWESRKIGRPKFPGFEHC
jgi:hypothetical protein